MKTLIYSFFTMVLHIDYTKLQFFKTALNSKILGLVNFYYSFLQFFSYPVRVLFFLHFFFLCINFTKIYCKTVTKIKTSVMSVVSRFLKMCKVSVNGCNSKCKGEIGC